VALSEQWINLFGTHTTLIFESIGDENKWAETLKQLVEDLDARFGVLAVDNAAVSQMYTFQRVDSEAKKLSRYLEHYIKHDPWLEKLVDLKTEKFLRSDDVIDLNDYKRSIFYKDWARHFGLAHAIGGYIAVKGRHGLRLALQRDERQGAFTVDELHYLNLLRPQLKTAAKLHIEQLQKRQQKESAGYLKFTTTPALVCDQDCHVIEVNAAALALMNVYPTAKIRGGKFLLDSPFQKKLNKALNQDLYSLTNPAASEVQITLQRDHPSNWIVVKVTPLQWSDKSSANAEPESHFLIHLAEPVNIQPWHFDLLKETYELTKAETDICLKLCQGMCLEAVAQLKNRSLSTIRTQLKSIFAKTGVSQQSQLVSLILQRHFL